MRLGLVITPVYDRGTDPLVHVAEHEQAVTRAGELGFSTVFVGQHFLGSELRFYQPVPYLAHLAHFAPGVRVATGIALLALINPVEAAEQIATLDVVTRGRAVFGVGLGYADRELTAFGVERRTRVARFTEAVRLVRLLWSGEEVDFDGSFFQVNAARPAVLPLQRPGPPVWLGGQAESAVRRAAREADAWYAAPFVRDADLRPLREAFLDERARHGLPLAGEFPLRRDIVIAGSVAGARRLALERSRSRYDTYARWGLDAGPGGAAADTGYSALDAEEIDQRFILGPPQACVEQIAGLRDRTGLTELVIKVHWPGLPHQAAMEQLELFGAEVMPHL